MLSTTINTPPKQGENHLNHENKQGFVPWNCKPWSKATSWAVIKSPDSKEGADSSSRARGWRKKISNRGSESAFSRHNSALGASGSRNLGIKWIYWAFRCLTQGMVSFLTKKLGICGFWGDFCREKVFFFFLNHLELLFPLPKGRNGERREWIPKVG